jgi:hypothetical protein
MEVIKKHNVLPLKAALLQIRVNIHENFGNVFTSKIL